MEKMPRVSPDPVLELVHALDRTEILYGACQLGVFESLERMRKPTTAKDLAENMQVHALSLEKLLNACVPLGLLNKSREILNGVEKGYYSNTILASSYLTEGDFSLLGLVHAARHQYDIYSMVKTGKKDDDRLWFTDAKENARVAKENPVRFRRYYMKQDGYSRSCFQLLRMVDLSPYRTCVDLGGGVGSVSRALMLLYHGMKVACVDYPDVIELAKQVEASRGHMKINHANTLREFEVEYTPADMWVDPLPRADLYVLGHILQMFDDEKCTELLKKIYEHTNRDGALLVLEKILNPQKDSPEAATAYDVRLMGSKEGGHMRTRNDFIELLTACGFHYLHFYDNDGVNAYDIIFAQRSTAPEYKTPYADR